MKAEEVTLTASQVELLKTGNTYVFQLESKEDRYYCLPYFYREKEIMRISNSVKMECVHSSKLIETFPKLASIVLEQEADTMLELRKELASSKEIIDGLEDAVVNYQEQIYLLNKKLEDNKKEIADLYYKLKT